MTFIQLQNKIIQTRKARSGVHNRIDYFADDVNVNEDYWQLVYKKALKAANDVLKHYEKVKEISPKDKVTVTVTIK